MQRTLTVVVAIALCLGAAYILYRSHTQSAPTVDYTSVPLTKPYANQQYAFSLSMPGTFSAREMPDDTGGVTILLESSDRADGVQITITPFDENLQQLTEARIRSDVPDLTIADAQPVDIGSNNKGLAFKSDNDAFDGASREVWFVFRGNLYQISTYDRLDPLLKNIFSTWRFL